ncbi:MAG: bifunctional 5,10-methylenetetrahydrofolate dehydrogenase/5,10-methenyltetrahydrofolate cyclohydrolase [Lachnospiraceae bacterium]|nr:bifunctional 5,10-methylenetetrahydrofolate dehydrogenase/5,10-methenyltetrahydrofolate cyclohydrolase [Lachnospiraceae bacterium]
MYKLIDGKKISKEILRECKEKIDTLKLDISLHTVRVGDNPATIMYMQSQQKKCEEVGVKYVAHILPRSASEKEVIDLIHSLNEDSSVDGIFIQIPLPKTIDIHHIINEINPQKDVDGFNIENTGSLVTGLDGMLPCTARGIIELIKRSDITLDGKHVVVVGRSNIVGKPVALLCLKEDATVTICHTHTKNLKDICKAADILIVAIRDPEFIDDEYIKDGVIVIDVGTHKIDGRVCGDVDFEKVKNHCEYITPVPGGVGPMTVAMLLKNLLRKY